MEQIQNDILVCSRMACFILAGGSYKRAVIWQEGVGMHCRCSPFPGFYVYCLRFTNTRLKDLFALPNFRTVKAEQCKRQKSLESFWVPAGLVKDHTYPPFLALTINPWCCSMINADYDDMPGDCCCFLLAPPCFWLWPPYSAPALVFLNHLVSDQLV